MAGGIVCDLMVIDALTLFPTQLMNTRFEVVCGELLGLIRCGATLMEYSTFVLVTVLSFTL